MRAYILQERKDTADYKSLQSIGERDLTNDLTTDLYCTSFGVFCSELLRPVIACSHHNHDVPSANCQERLERHHWSRRRRDRPSLFSISSHKTAESGQRSIRMIIFIQNFNMFRRY
ncbi:uncharacterized protein LOC143809067 [Ranitomeya variabilis]|uniref:uncharacterized protein LOC143809067 n=1 Tax=Ranitomeya variabilis TaxID=490064 RepID=UPI0040568F11